MTNIAPHDRKIADIVRDRLRYGETFADEIARKYETIERGELDHKDLMHLRKIDPSYKLPFRWLSHAGRNELVGKVRTHELAKRKKPA
jgi:hypothetical protein